MSEHVPQSPLAGDRQLAWLERRLLQFRGPRPSVGVVVVGWDAARARAAVEVVDAWVHEQAVDLQSATLVCNRDLHLYVAAPWTIVEGSNRAGEFSGYDEGIARGGLNGGPAVWVLLNDRYASYGALNLDAVFRPVLEVVARYPVVVGHVDHLHGRPYKNGTTLDSYVRTNFMVISAASLPAALPFARHPLDVADSLFPPGWPLVLGPSETLDEEYLLGLSEWLTGRGRLRGKAWYRATEDPAATDMLRAKAVSILNEHLLSLSLTDQGIIPADTRRVMRSAALIRRPEQLRTEIAQWRNSDISYDARRLRVQSILRATAALLRPDTA